MKLTVRTAIRLKASIEHALNGRPRAIRRNNEDVLITEPYKLASDLVLTLALNAAALEKSLQAYEVSRRKVLADHKDDVVRAAAEIETLLDGEIDAQIRKVELSAFKIDDNQGISAAIPGLLPMAKYQAPKGGED